MITEMIAFLGRNVPFYHVSADYLLLGKDFDTPKEPVQKERLISRKAIDIIAVITVLALSTVLLIAGLSIIEKLL